MIRCPAPLPALACAAPPAASTTLCPPGTRAAVLAMLHFGLVQPNGDDVTEAQWRTFRSDILDAVLRTPITEGAELRAPQRFSIITSELRANWVPDAPPQVLAVTRAWTARFPDAPV